MSFTTLDRFQNQTEKYRDKHRKIKGIKNKLRTHVGGTRQGEQHLLNNDCVLECIHDADHHIKYRAHSAAATSNLYRQLPLQLRMMAVFSVSESWSQVGAAQSHLDNEKGARTPKFSC